MSWKNVQYGKKRVRRNYARVQTNVDLPNLIEVQTGSFQWLIETGLKELFHEISPIRDHGDGEKFELYFGEYEFDEPKYTIQEAKVHSVNYSRALKVNVRLINKETGEIKEDKIFMGEFPFMTPWGTFIINGSERVIVTQIIRSAGVFFSKEKNKKTGRVNYSGQIIPTRGAWIEFELGTKDIFYAKLDRSKKVPLSTFIKALGVKRNQEITELFGDSEFMRNTFGKDNAFGEDDAIKELYDRLRPGEKTSADTARKFIASRLFDVRRYDLASVGRYKVNKKLDVVQRAIGHRLAKDLVNKETGEIILPAGTEILYKDSKGVNTVEEAETLRNAYIVVDREIFGELPEGVYYIADLLGLDVYTEDGTLLGKVDDIFSTGSNDVYVVKDELGKQKLLPGIDEVIKQIDLESGKIIVNLIEGL